MTIDWNSFTPYASLAGGVLIGLAAAMLFLLNGRIAGVSGILGVLLSTRGERAWRALFIAGLLLAPLAWRTFEALPAIVVEAGYAELIVAGLLVGVGTRYPAAAPADTACAGCRGWRRARSP